MMDDELDEGLQAEPGVAHPGEGMSPLAGWTRGRVSVARPTAWWYVAATTEELGTTPIARTVLGIPLVLFRDGRGEPHALLDRCPHRNVPLSGGRVLRGELECPYHGWRFDGDGRCRFIPSLEGDCAAKARNAPAFATKERDGFVWVYATPGAEPKVEPYRLRLADVPGYTTVRHTVDAPGTLFSTVENALDVPHTAFLHRGLFRGENRQQRITAVVRRRSDRVEAEYIGEARPSGLAGRLLSPSGGLVTHFDRFILPSIAEVEYRIGDENHLLVAAVMTPVRDFETRIHAVVSFRVRAPATLVKRALLPVALRIFAQDAAILKAQTETIHRFGGEQFASSEIDVLGRHIWRLLRAAERGALPVDEEVGVSEERVTLVL
jgi:phenylpropionate dioxygenase-like ring-hydroxylating dioxygenase large terminal subunit